MIEPPPRQLEISASTPLKVQMSKKPSRPSLGSQKLTATSRGLRGKSPGAHDLPRSSTHTDLPPSRRRCAVTEPPKPEPTTIASKCSRALIDGTSLSKTA